MRALFGRTLIFISMLALTPGCQAIKELGKAVRSAVRQSHEKSGERSTETVEKTLQNGLTVVVQENRSAPVAAVQVWIKAGSADERQDQAGMAHLVEHMVFKGTEKRAVGEAAAEVEALGGDLNAFTSHDQTVYYVTLASRFYDKAIDILADLVQNAVFNPQELEREKQVVIEEISRGMDNPSSRIYKYMFEQAYEEHTYRRPVIGFRETVESFDRGDVAEFYDTWYVPGNMTVVVVGDVYADEVINTVENCLGERPEKEAPAESPRAEAEPLQQEPRSVLYREDVSESYMYLGFHIPGFAATDMAALDVLSVIMGRGETSRMVYRIRTARQLVNRIWAYTYTPMDPGMFLVGMNLSEKKAHQAVEIILKQLYLLKHEPVFAWEIEKAKLEISAESIYSRETMEGQARKLGHFMVLTGDPDYEKAYLQQVAAVTKQDLMRVANKYFHGKNLTVAGILPQGPGNEAKGFSESGLRSIIQKTSEWDLAYQPGTLVEPRPISAPEVPELKEMPLPRAGQAMAHDPVKFTLKNGVRLIVRENHAVPLVSVRAAFLGGLRFESRDKNGISNFIAETMTEGTKSYSAQEIHSVIEARAGDIDGYSGRNSLGVTLEVPAQFFDSCLPVFAEVLRYPEFPEEQVESKRAIIASNIKSRMDRPSYVAFKMFRSKLFSEHPFGMEILGAEASLNRITREDIQGFYQKLATPKNLVIAVVGDVEAKELRERFEGLFQDWEGRDFEVPDIAREAPPHEVREALECTESEQANIVIGFQGVSLTSEDRFPASVIEAILSGMSGRLFTTLRGEQGLAYSVFAFSQEGLDPGYLGVYIGTAPENEHKAVEGILRELERIRNEPVSDLELSRAKRVLIGEYEIRLQRFSNQAAHYAMDELYGLGYMHSHQYPEKIEALTKRDVRRVAKEYIRPDAYVKAVVKPCTADAGEGG